MPTDAEIYGYGTLANILCCVCSLGGAVILPCAKNHKAAYHVVLSIFMGLAVGTLASDALLHLIPEAFGLHSHDHHATHEVTNTTVTHANNSMDHMGHDPHHHDTEDGHNHTNHDEHDDHNKIHVENYVWYSLIVMLGIYVFYILEVIMTSVQKRSKYEHHFRSQDLADIGENNFTKMNEGTGEKSTDTKSESSTHFTPLVIMIIVGDAIHNFADGLAVAAAMSSSLIDGLSITIAIFCHELPHELGDFAVLMSSGMGFCKAILCNLFSSLTALIGFYVGVPISKEKFAKEWIFAITAGMFLYISLVDMLPKLVKDGHGRWRTIIYHNIGIILGAAVIVILAVFENLIHL